MLTNKQALKALEIFEDCQKQNFSFRLKYAMGRNIPKLQTIKRAYDSARDVSNDPDSIAFIRERNEYLNSHNAKDPNCAACGLVRPVR